MGRKGAWGGQSHRMRRLLLHGELKVGPPTACWVPLGEPLGREKPRGRAGRAGCPREGRRRATALRLLLGTAVAGGGGKKKKSSSVSIDFLVLIALMTQDFVEDVCSATFLGRE